jgi:hypothetical protein
VRRASATLVVGLLVVLGGFRRGDRSGSGVDVQPAAWL